MKTKILQDTVRRLLEADDPEKTAVKEATSSLDTQVKKILRSAIATASNDGIQNESIDFRSLCRVLFEASEDEDEGGDEEDKKEEEPAEPQEPQKKTLETIDIASYADAVVRLVENFSSLIEVNGAVIAMAKLILAETHDESTVRALTSVLSEEYSMEEDESKWDKELENQPPPAKGAGVDGA